MPASENPADAPGADIAPAPIPEPEPEPGPQRAVLRAASITDLLAVVPVLLGFEPSERDVVLLGMTAECPAVQIVLRYDAPGSEDAAVLARDTAALLAANGFTRACAVGYGHGEVITPVADAVHQILPGAGITVTEFLRVHDGRYWSYHCDSPACCPPEGTPFDLTAHPVTSSLKDKPLASREAFAATIAAKGGKTGTAMRRATRACLADLGRRLAALEREGTGVSAARLTAQLGLPAVGDAIESYRAGGSVTVEQAAFLTVALGQLRVRDDAWARMDPAFRAAHLRLWTDLTRLARPGYVAAPAALLAFVAWQSGSGALANVAVERALADNPHYSMAELIGAALNAGAPPSAARLPMTPEEVAASYDAQEAAAAAAAAADTDTDTEQADAQALPPAETGDGSSPQEPAQKSIPAGTAT